MLIFYSWLMISKIFTKYLINLYIYAKLSNIQIEFVKLESIK